MSRHPRFRKRDDGSLALDNTPEARDVAAANRKRPTIGSSSPEEIQRQAIAAVKRSGGNVADRAQVLGQHRAQFGQYRGQTFLWLLENSLGYCGWLVDNMWNERQTSAPLSANKFLFKEYVQMFKEGREVVEIKQQEREQGKRPQTVPQEMTPVPVNVQSLVKRKNLPPEVVAAKLAKLQSPRKAVSETDKLEITDQDLIKKVTDIERQIEGSQPVLSQSDSPGRSQLTPPHVNFDLQFPLSFPESQSSDQSQVSQTPETVPAHSQTRNISLESPSGLLQRLQSANVPTYCLPEGWQQTLPPEDQAWVASALFLYSPRSGKPELDPRKVDRLWYSPSSPAVTCNQRPKMDKYFAHRLLLWMPKRLWQVVLRCPQAGCLGRELTSAGIYQRVRQVIDVSSTYNLASEYLECGACKKKYISWSTDIVKQLDMGHQLQFQVLLTYRYACDMSVVRLLRERGLGNSSTQIRKKLVEQHGETWMQHVALYLSDCANFSRASRQGLLQSATFQPPPSEPILPQAAWLMKVHAMDVMSRMEEIQSAVTSIFGTILKMDSTKKVVKKLAGRAGGTASWQTNVGNEFGQVLTSILTSGEGYGLGPMARGLIQRYSAAGIPPPHLLYVDRDCCSGNTARLFSDWPDLVIRLDVWHFMRRIATICTTESHQLYGVFMGRLSSCIFEWSQEDLNLLKEAKQSEIESSGAGPLPPMDWISKKELALHCRRRTRGAAKTTSLVQELLEHFSGDAGLDTMGVPLFDKSRVWDTWESQRKHIPCIQDPEGVTLYTRTGTLTKGGIQLPTYRCARGSTSLESFHLHLNRFIPGTAARDVYYQAYLLDGLVRWNENRAAVIQENVRKHRISRPSYNSKVLHTINNLSESVLGSKVFPQFEIPMKFTGELIGVEYLYSQTGEVLQDLADAEASDDDDTAELVEDIVEEEDQDDPTIGLVSSPPRSGVSQRIRPGSQPQMPRDPESEPAWKRVSRRLELEQNRPSTHPSTATAPPSASTSIAPPPPVLPSSSTAPPPEQEDVEPESTDLDITQGPDSIPGYDAVENLADYLVGLRHDTSGLTNAQATEICHLWDLLHDYDKQATKFSPRHKSKLTKGRFKLSKSPSPGVDSTKRCFLGGNTGPAQWPDCNRYVEATIIKLCTLYPSPVKEKSKTTMRWTLITRAYKSIREKVIQNPTVMDRTSIQMVAINNTTLTQWYNKREKRQERDVLTQAVKLDTPSIEASEPLPEAVTKPSIPLPSADVQKHIYVLPQNTAGKGRKPRSKVPTLQPTPVLLHGPNIIPIAPAPLPAQMPILVPTGPKLSRTAEWYRRRKELDTGKAVRSYTRQAGPKHCSKCHQPRTAETGHQQYKGNWHCQSKDKMSVSEWKAALLQQIAEKKQQSDK